MRSIELLAREYPNKTGAELFEIQEQDKIADEKKFRKIHAKQLKLIDDINTNGGFYKGTFGLNQYFYYSFSNLRLESGKIYCDVQHLVAFDTERMSVELKNDIWKEFENYGASAYEKITKEEFDKAVDYYKAAFGLLWKYINKADFYHTHQ